MTGPACRLGTPHYMSPSRRRGAGGRLPEPTCTASARALRDAAGEPPFTGPSSPAILSKVLTERPAPIRSRRETVPSQVEDAVMTALAKLPADRFSSATEFPQSLASAGPTTRRLTAAATTLPIVRRPYHGLLPYGALALTTTLALWGWAHRVPAEHLEIVRFTLEPGAGDQLAFPVSGVVTYLALSPDGQQVVYAGTHGGRQWALDLRHLDQLQARTLPGTQGASHPEFSPNGRWIAFGAADGSLRKIAVDGTGLTTLAQLDAAGINGLTWLSDRELVFTRTNLAFRGLWRVSADGGRPSRLIETRRWLAGIFNREEFSEKQQHEVTLDLGQLHLAALGAQLPITRSSGHFLPRSFP